MLIGIDSSPCSLSLRNRSTLSSTTKCHQNKSDLKNVFVQKSFFFNIFYSFNPNRAYWNQRRLFSGNLPGMLLYFNRICRINTPNKITVKLVRNCEIVNFHLLIFSFSVSLPICVKRVTVGYFPAICLVCLLLIAALIYSAGYYSAAIFFTSSNKKCFALPHFAAFSTFCVKSF